MNPHILVLLAAAALGAGCAKDRLPRTADLPRIGDLPFVHKIDIQQGNVVTQEMVAQLEPGMDKKKVNFIMGSPIIVDTFHADRWDYLYTFQPGGGRREMRRITLVFEEDLLARVEGDIVPAAGRLEVDTRQDMTVVVPGGYKPGLMTKLKNTIPFVGAEDEAGKKGGDAEGESTSDAEAVAAAEPFEEPVPEVTVPEGKPPKKKRGFFSRIFGIGDDDEKDEDEALRAEDNRRYRDITDPDAL